MPVTGGATWLPAERACELLLTVEVDELLLAERACELLLTEEVLPLERTVVPEERVVVPEERVVCWLLPEERLTWELLLLERVVLPVERVTCWLLPEERLTWELLPEERVVVPLERVVVPEERVVCCLPVELEDERLPEVLLLERVAEEPPPEREERD